MSAATPERFLLAASAMGAAAVGAGAFGAHALNGSVEPDLMDVWHTAAHYHLIHSLALLVVAFAALGKRDASTDAWFARAYLCWFFGIVIFSGSLYALVLTGIRGLGAATPVGGILLILGWLLLAVPALKSHPPR